MKIFSKICESAHTRWLTHGRTNAAIRDGYVPLMWGMRADTARGDPTAHGLMTEMLTFKFAGTQCWTSSVD